MVITGARAGLGKLLAYHYASVGYRVVGCSRSPVDDTFPNYDHVQADVSDEAGVKSLFRCASEVGPLRVVINNAGLGDANHALLTPVAVVRQMLETTVVGTFLCSREAAKAMRKTGGSIVNLSSDHVRFATPGTSVYGAAKAAVEQFSRVFAKEVAPFDVRVSCLSLPYIHGTGMADRFPATGSSAIPYVGVADVARALEPLIAPSPDGESSGETAYVAAPA